MPALPITRVVLYKHGLGYFEREDKVDGDTAVSLTFKQSEVSDVLKSLTVLDLDGGHIASVSYDSTKPLEVLLAEVSLSIPDDGSLVGLLPQIKGARVLLRPAGGDACEGMLLGVDTIDKQTVDGVARTVMVSVLTDQGALRSFPLHGLTTLDILDASLRRDLDFYLKTQLSAKKKDARAFTFFAEGKGQRRVRISYTLAAPVWKATYRVLLGEEGKAPLIQGWAVVDNTQDEDWENVQLSLIAGLPVSFIHDLYTPRYIRRPVIQVQETTGVLPPMLEEGIPLLALDDTGNALEESAVGAPAAMMGAMPRPTKTMVAGPARMAASMPSSMTTQVRERKVGDLFEYAIEHPVTIRRNQSALVPIVLREFKGRPVLLYDKNARANNPMRCVEFENTTGLTLEGGPITVLEGGTYVGEAMLETVKPGEQRLLAFAVELSVHVLDNIETHTDKVHRVLIRHGLFSEVAAEVWQTTYTFNNKADHPATLYLSHPRSTEWQLVDSPAPKETTENTWRFLLELPAGQVTKFVIKQKRQLSQGTSLSNLSHEQITVWLEKRFLSKPMEQALRQLAELVARMSLISQQRNELQGERTTIHNDQKRIRENLQGLGERTSEVELRERFVHTLHKQEDRLDQLEQELKKNQAMYLRTQTQIKELLEKLEYELDIA